LYRLRGYAQPGRKLFSTVALYIGTGMQKLNDCATIDAKWSLTRVSGGSHGTASCSYKMGGGDTLTPGVDLKNVEHRKYGQELHFWYFEKKIVENPIYLSGEGRVLLGGSVSPHSGPLMPSNSSSIDVLTIVPEPYFVHAENL
jgi:hypothetical protein